jgi:hypothetical protein
MNGKREKKDGLDMFIQKPTGKTILFSIFFAPLLAVLLFSVVSPKYVWILFGPDPRYQPAGWIIVGGVILYWSGLYFLSRRQERIIVELVDSPERQRRLPGWLRWLVLVILGALPLLCIFLAPAVMMIMASPIGGLLPFL